MVFDPDYAIGDFEDADLCLRAAALGLRCAVDMTVRAYHLERQSQNAAPGEWRRNLNAAECLDLQPPDQAGAPCGVTMLRGRLRGARPVRRRRRLACWWFRICTRRCRAGGAEIAAYQLYHALKATPGVTAWFAAGAGARLTPPLGTHVFQPFGPDEFVLGEPDYDPWLHSGQAPRFGQELRDLVAELRPTSYISTTSRTWGSRPSCR